MRSARRGDTAVLCSILVAGTALRLWQYLARTSLWFDELALVRSIVERPLGPLLTRPLLHGQSAPKGFLLLERLAVVAFCRGELGLRLVPLLSALAALFLFARLACRILPARAAGLATLLFAAAPPLIVYGAQVKPYATDVAVAIALTLLALELAPGPHATPAPAPDGNTIRLAAVAGSALVWLSQPAVFVAGGLLAVLLLDRHRLRANALVIATWAASAIGAAVAARASLTDDTLVWQQVFWRSGFPPPSLRAAVLSRWPWHEIRSLLGTAGAAGLGHPWPWLVALLALVGIVAIARRHAFHAAVLLAPAALTLLAAVLGQYPFCDRLLLFLVPAFLITAAAGADALGSALSSLTRLQAAGTAVAVALVLPALLPLWRNPPPYRFEDLRPLLAELERERHAGDEVYVYYAALPAVAHYGREYGLEAGTYVPGGCHRGDNRGYLAELDALRGRPRVWLVITHSIPGYREREDIVAYLDAIGTPVHALTVPSRSPAGGYAPAELLLYDLSDATRLSTATAATFPVSGSGLDPRFPCSAGALTIVDEIARRQPGQAR